MKSLLTFILAAAFAGIAFGAPDKDALMTKENAAWQAFKDKNADGFKKVVSGNMMAVYADGIQNLEAEMSGMQQWTMKSFAISDYKVTAAGADTAITTYTVKIEGTVGGKDASGTYNAGSVWQKEGGEWKAIFHSNVIAAPAAAK